MGAEERPAQRDVPADQEDAPALTVVLASPRSFCAGVVRAIETVERALATHDGPVYVRRQIVHNVHVVADLEARGAIFVDELDDIPDPPPPGAVVVFAAHGVSPAVRADAGRRGLPTIDATCPLVSKVHAEAARFARQGDAVVLIGHGDHEETEGTMGEAPGVIRLVQTAADVAGLEIADGRVAYLTQTTLAVDETAEIVDALRQRFPGLVGPGSDDICYATTNRQRAIAQIAAEADLVLVVGSANSSNSVRLVEVAARTGTTAHLIEDVTDIDPAWLRGVRVLGLSAGASAPDHLVSQVIAFLRERGTVVVEERVVAAEHTTFTLPKQDA
jgi:4-hydroxy-3-methylbut-2-en-1-yl diphosphate reductase